MFAQDPENVDAPPFVEPPSQIVAHPNALSQPQDGIQVFSMVQVNGPQITPAEDSPQSLEPLPPPAVSTPVSRRKKRKADSGSHDPTPSPQERKAKNDDDDDGSTCPICLDSWELTGEHRLVSLKCGHLFGDSCIRRWFSGSAAAARCCPSCKTKANLRDLRPIYAKRICVVDTAEEYKLQQKVNEEMQKVSSLKQEVKLKLDLQIQQKRVEIAQLYHILAQVNEL